MKRAAASRGQMSLLSLAQPTGDWIVFQNTEHGRRYVAEELPLRHFRMTADRTEALGFDYRKAAQVAAYVPGSNWERKEQG